MNKQKIYTYKKIIITFITATLFLAAGCGSAETEPPNWQKIDDKFVMQEDFSKYVHYADAESLIFSVEHEDHKYFVGPATNTRALVEYDLSERAISHIYPIDTVAQINDAVPIESGIIYVDYDDEESRKNHIGDEIIGIDWQIVRADKDKTEIIAKGKCDDYSTLPELEVIDGEIVALWCDRDKNCSALSKITNEGLENIIQEKHDWLLDTQLQSNTEEVCFTLKNGSDYAQIAVANLDGLLTICDLDGKIESYTSYTLAKDNIICGIRHEETKQFELLNYNIRTQEEKREQIEEPLYRMKGGDSDYVVCVYSSYEIVMFNCKDSTIETIFSPPGMTGKPVYFAGLTANKVIAAVLIDNDYLIYEGFYSRDSHKA